ncbi:MAG TPA: hypothetical protein VGV36_05775 [Solirubrobacteraceae bacterium]|nr:hypothetical protein [Solirubrobacteraceae bacterium]
MESPERRGPDEQLEHDTEELDDRIQHLGEGIEESRNQLQPRQKDTDDPHLRDWGDEEEESESEEDGGGDPAAFDDPEKLEEGEEA